MYYLFLDTGQALVQLPITIMYKLSVILPKEQRRTQKGMYLHTYLVGDLSNSLMKDSSVNVATLKKHQKWQKMAKNEEKPM